MVPNQLDANHELEKAEPEPSHQPSPTVEGPYNIIPDIGNKKPPHSYNPLEPAAQKVRYVLCNSDCVYTYIRTYVCMLHIQTILVIIRA